MNDWWDSVFDAWIDAHDREVIEQMERDSMTQLGRRFPNPGELEQIVYAEVETMVSNSVTFTAYMISKVLRERNSELEIVHDAVRDIVHDYMEQRYDGVTYESGQRVWNQHWARTWYPMLNSGVVAGKVATTPLPAPTVPQPPAVESAPSKPKTARKQPANKPQTTATGLPAPIDLSEFDGDGQT